MKKVVLSGINLIDGGPLSVYKDCLNAIIESEYIDKYEFIILVNNKALFSEYEGNFKILEFPKSKKSWLARLYYEYFYFKRLSKKLVPFLWFSLHDMTPNVVADVRAVYCHNSTISYNMPLSLAKYDKKVYLFSKFYKYLYKINIKKNNYVIVQQQWLKRVFEDTFKIDNLVVARPDVNYDSEILKYTNIQKKDKGKYRFIYVAFPRVFKNFEVICKACEILNEKNLHYEVVLTLDGTENLYSKELHNKYLDCENIKFVGLKPRDEVYNMYSYAEALIFASKLESWGLPITEFQQYKKPMLVVDLPYAHETVGQYEKVNFFEADDYKQLAELMERYIKDENVVYDKNSNDNCYDCHSWRELVDFLLRDKAE